MGRIEAYYPAQTENIVHFGKDGSSYRLDAIDIPVRLARALSSNPEFNVSEVSGNEGSVLYNSHSAELIDSYKTGEPSSLANSSGLMWQKGFYQWVVNKAWTTIEALEMAAKTGRSLAITSGGHHAEYASGHGFGPICNMVIGVRELLRRSVIDKVAILDLDVHFANGTHSLVKDDKNILSCDLWKYRLPKWKYTPNSESIFHLKVEDKDDYLAKLDLVLERISRFRPDLLILYHGLDVLAGDRMGGVKGFNEQVLIKRTKLVKRFIRANSIPTSVFIGGGYTDYADSKEGIEKSKQHLVDLFVESISSVLSRP
jgi:acetoin utilization deacetylase AcuC-like enzyme